MDISYTSPNWDDWTPLIMKNHGFWKRVRTFLLPFVVLLRKSSKFIQENNLNQAENALKKGLEKASLAGSPGSPGRPLGMPQHAPAMGRKFAAFRESHR